MFLPQTSPGYFSPGRAAVTPCRVKAPWLNLKMRLFFPALPSGRSVGLSFSLLPTFPPPLFPPQPPFGTPPPLKKVETRVAPLNASFSHFMGGKPRGGGKVIGNGIDGAKIALPRALAFSFSSALRLVVLARSRAIPRCASLSTLVALVAAVCGRKKLKAILPRRPLAILLPLPRLPLA